MFKKKTKYQANNLSQINWKKTSYSQCGEDLIVEYIFNLRGLKKPSYIDIGAHHPFFLSNTAMFYSKGCRGINIEANPELFGLLVTERSEDINLNMGIGANQKQLDFYVMEDDTLSTFSKEELTNLIASGQVLKTTKTIKVNTVENVINEFWNTVFPDFLNLDVEGLDFEILQSIKFEQQSPKIICVEAAEYSSIGAGKRKDDLINFLLSKNYYEYANTNLNAIMVRRDFWFI